MTTQHICHNVPSITHMDMDNWLQHPLPQNQGTVLESFLTHLQGVAIHRLDLAWQKKHRKCSGLATSMGISCELGGNADSQTTPDLLNPNLHFDKIHECVLCTSWSGLNPSCASDYCVTSSKVSKSSKPVFFSSIKWRTPASLGCYEN